MQVSDPFGMILEIIRYLMVMIVHMLRGIGVAGNDRRVHDMLVSRGLTLICVVCRVRTALVDLVRFLRVFAKSETKDDSTRKVSVDKES